MKLQLKSNGENMEESSWRLGGKFRELRAGGVALLPEKRKTSYI